MKHTSIHHLLFAAFAWAVMAGNASATLITFEDGTGQDNVISFSNYPDIGVSNAVYITDPNFSDGAFGMGVDNGVSSPNDWAFPGTTSPIVISFTSADASFVSIEAYAVGANGARIEAYNGATLVDSDQFVGTGFGVANVATTLSVIASNITEIHLLQVNDPTVIQDGIGWDNLNYTLLEATGDSIPEPMSVALMMVGMIGLSRNYMRRKMSSD